MSAFSRADLLQTLRDETAGMVRDYRAGEITPTDLARTAEDRQKLVEQLGDFAGPVTAAESALAKEIASLDRTLARWCETKQREIARHLVRHSKPKRPDETPARIINQTA